MQSIFAFHYFVNHDSSIFEGYVSNVVFYLKRSSVTVEHFMASHLEILKGVHDKLAVRNAGEGLVGKTTNARDFLLALHVDYPSQIATVGVALNPYELGDVDGLSIVDAFFINVPNTD